MESCIADTLTSKFKDGSLNLRGGDKVEVEMPQDLLDPLPTLPKLNKLVVTGLDKTKLQIPIALVKDWQFHNHFGRQFS